MNHPQNKDKEETVEQTMARRAQMPVRLIRLREKDAADDNGPVLSAEEVGKFVGRVPSDKESPKPSSDQ
ncbi:MAG: hypothetical protein ACR2FY_26135 [Pirellulaceae bacterium]